METKHIVSRKKSGTIEWLYRLFGNSKSSIYIWGTEKQAAYRFSDKDVAQKTAMSVDNTKFEDINVEDVVVEKK